MDDPLLRLKRRRYLLRACALPVLAGAGGFAVSPWFTEAPQIRPIEVSAQSAQERSHSERGVGIDATAFEVTLWESAELSSAGQDTRNGKAGEAGDREEAQFQLLGISDARGVLRAIVYVISSGKVHIVTEGDSLEDPPGASRVRGIRPREVELMRDGQALLLTLAGGQG